ncbi:beta-xylosidase/alpha-L-arabinofuranosidase 1-like [Quercus lobata]|uniref:beta-xylosidase/alpha-L-arabinofuranosidase 1-like n=1 Tax=Quercus lobata TaxID=97700 RepID=UPI001245B3F3|nr:beta-xylosidase/alpha-L-arabinofuranosidase 1-like [Quercus lobata]
MPKILSFLLCLSFTITSFVICIDEKEKVLKISTDAATPTGSDFTYICDPARYAKLKLDMKSFAFCDSKLPYNVRAKDLVDQMTLAEKIAQLGNNADGVARLGLPKYEWWSEALHGLSNVGPGTVFDNLVPHATSFPTVILTAASFNEKRWREIGQVVSTEARAMYNLGRSGLTFWSPTINVARDPRWGRIIETPGEDPFIVGTYASNYVRGLQDVAGTEHYKDLNTRPLKVAACCKHFAAYDVDNWHGVDRYHFDARVTEQDLEESFLRPFEMCVKDGDASSVMCSYNRVNGIPSCADPKLLRETLRQEWNLHGYIVADCDSVEVMVTGHKFLNDSNEDAVAQTLKAGLDLDCGAYYPKYLGNAVNQGKVRESNIDEALQNLYIVLLRAGYFDGLPAYKALGKNDICTNRSIELATQVAREGITLLKNDGPTLPLNTATFKTLAVVGPHANSTVAMIGNYAFDPRNPGSPCRYTSPIDGFSTYGKVNYAAGCGDVKCKDASLIPPAVEAAKTADATIIVTGLDLSIEAEGLDRLDLLLPGKQTDLINQVAAAAKGPVILVLMTAGGVDISFAKTNPKIKAILWVGYPGAEGGRAIADVVFGQYNPAGRLPITWYQADYINKLPLTSMQFRPDDSQGYPGRTYKFFNGPTVFPFGFGLSYTKFNYTLNATVPSLSAKLQRFTHCHDLNYMANKTKPTCPAILVSDLQCGEYIELTLVVQNVGGKVGSEVVLVYSKPPDGITGTFLKQLIGFQRVYIAAGASQEVKFVFNGCKSLGIVDNAGNNILPFGGHTIIVGDGVASFPVQVTFHN